VDRYVSHCVAVGLGVVPQEKVNHDRVQRLGDGSRWLTRCLQALDLATHELCEAFVMVGIISRESRISNSAATSTRTSTPQIEQPRISTSNSSPGSRYGSVFSLSSSVLEYSSTPKYASTCGTLETMQAKSVSQSTRSIDRVHQYL